MIEMEQIKARCWNVPQFFREQKDVWTEKQGHYSTGKVRDRFTISDKVDVVEKCSIFAPAFGRERPSGQNRKTFFEQLTYRQVVRAARWYPYGADVAAG